jgi:hypothetical protein
MRTAIYPQASGWWFFRVLTRLVTDGFIIARTEGDAVPVALYQLSKKGFEFITHDLPELIEKRFNAQSVVHDSMAAAFHLGEFIHGIPKGVSLVSEQELQCFDPGSYPAGIPKSREHIPDGYTIIENGSERKIYAIEVEIRVKSIQRYDRVSLHFDLAKDVEAVLWLVNDVSVFEVIAERLIETKTKRLSIHNFVMLDHFKKDGWNSPIYFGSFKNKTVHQLLNATGVQLPCSKQAAQQQQGPAEIFFQNLKWPRPKHS